MATMGYNTNNPQFQQWQQSLLQNAQPQSVAQDTTMKDINQQYADQLRQQNQPQQQGGGMNMGGGMGGLMQMFGGGAGAGAGAAGGGSAAGGIGSIGSAAGGSAAGGSAAGGGGFGSMAASAGPWAALAAIIAANEYNAEKGGYRREGHDQYQDIASGKVLEQDTEKRWAPWAQEHIDDKTGGWTGIGGDLKAWGNLSTGDFSNFWDNIKDESTIAKVLRKIF